MISHRVSINWSLVADLSSRQTIHLPFFWIFVTNTIRGKFADSENERTTMWLGVIFCGDFHVYN